MEEIALVTPTHGSLYTTQNVSGQLWLPKLTAFTAAIFNGA